MKICRTISEIKGHLSRCSLDPVGFVPTMGALHQGHLSLVERAISECPVAVVSIFVNPTQFNDKEDLLNYPRTEDNDIEMLGNNLRKNDTVFIPSIKEIYPVVDKRVFNFGSLANVLEGVYRPGHFNGVAQVVSRLFEIIEPDIAFFGQKDFQQLIIIKELVRQTGSRVKITGFPIIREEDGLAMSSRNRLLEPSVRKKAGIIFRTISAAAKMAQRNEIQEIKDFVRHSINNTEGFSLEYFEIVDDTRLEPVRSRREFSGSNRYFGCIALRAGKIRLIDNIEISLS